MGRTRARGKTRAAIAHGRVRAALVVAAAVLALGACGGGNAARPAQEPVRLWEQPAERLGPLRMLVPAGATEILDLAPIALAGSPATRGPVDVLFPAAWLDGFERRHGVQLRDATRLVLAWVDAEGLLLIGQGPWRSPDVVLANVAQMDLVDTESDAPFFWRGGFAGQTRLDFVAVADRVVVVAIRGPPALGALVERVRVGRWPDAGSAALDADGIAELSGHFSESLATYYELNMSSFAEVAEETPAALLLSAVREAIVGLGPASGAEHARVTVALGGSMPPTAADNFTALARSLADSAPGEALGLLESIETLRVTAGESDVVLTVEPRSEHIADGLRALFGGSLRELVGR